MPSFGGNGSEAFARSEVAHDAFSGVVVANERVGSGAVVKALRVPDGNESIERRVGDGEEEFDVVVEVELVATRHVLGELEPMPRLARRARAVAHELDDGFLLERQAAVVGNAFVHLSFELRRADLRKGG